MFEFRTFEEAFARDGGQNGSPAPPKILRRRKSLGKRIVFYAANLVLMPIVALVYLTVGAEGLRVIMPIFQMRLYKLPVPGAGMLRNYDGFDRLDLSMLMALILFIAVTLLWIRVFKELQEMGEITRQRSRNPILFYLLTGIAAIILLGDAGIFYVGLDSQTSSSWSEAPSYVAPAATVLYMAGLALIGAWHADYSHSPTV
ncbi:hypothetical protein [Blastopirellula marina]|uniref:Uncharacterized protein n=1 Tax=Blastopirellula marina DSM 3645 TaxID=314230 RepID=A3ZVG7_9BACT|nr:hypothetical protein [Blastopirellula marina]EAQ79313.1 hypothetical protein DSM3645_02518 [Blastopirellula marina DSM 3645]